MEPTFWHERWQTGVTPFHEGMLNRMLGRWFESLDLKAGEQVFVPLCGKAFDMRWLLEHGQRVLGVELSDIAVRDFFKENNIPLTRYCGNLFESFQGPDIQILCGDLFDLSATDLANVRCVYDRASLVALPQLDRQRYAKHLCQHLPVGTSMLLVSFEYDATRMNGPPFSVNEAEVGSLYEDRFAIRHLETAEVIEQYPRFQERGLNSILEHALLCTELR